MYAGLHLPGLCSYEVAGRRERVVPRAAWGLGGGLRPRRQGSTAAPQVGLAGLCSSSRTGQAHQGWWHIGHGGISPRPAPCRTRPQAEGLSWGGLSTAAAGKRSPASPRGRLSSWCGPHTYISYTKTCRWPGLQKPHRRGYAGRQMEPCWQRVAAGSEGGGRVGSTVEG